MSDLESAMQSLQERREALLTKMAAAEAIAKQTRQVAWKKVQDDGSLLGLLNAITTETEKPKFTRIVIKDEEVVNSWPENDREWVKALHKD